jgi:hypothetical protein
MIVPTGTSAVDEDLINELEQYTVQSQGKVLKINITDPETNLRVNLFSRNRQVELSETFFEYLNNRPEIEFKLV